MRPHMDQAAAQFNPFGHPPVDVSSQSPRESAELLVLLAALSTLREMRLALAPWIQTEDCDEAW